MKWLAAAVTVTVTVTATVVGVGALIAANRQDITRYIRMRQM